MLTVLSLHQFFHIGPAITGVGDAPLVARERLEIPLRVETQHAHIVSWCRWCMPGCWRCDGNDGYVEWYL